MCSYRETIAADIGLNTVIINMPRARANIRVGNRNCQTETPAARATTSSCVRVILANVQSPATSAANGNAFCAIKGIRNIAICNRIPIVASSRFGPEPLRIISTASKINMVAIKIRNTRHIPIVNWRVM